MNRLLLTFACALLTFASQAKAGLLLEPIVGYTSVVNTTKFGTVAAPFGAFSGQEMKTSYTGLEFGGRIGYALPMVFFAGEYMTGTYKPSVTQQPISGATVTVKDQTHTALGATVGVHIGKFRPYLTYVFDDQMKDDATTVYGTAFKLGFGFLPIPKLAINAAYIMGTETKEKSSSGTETTYSSSQTVEKSTSAGFFLGLSVPFEL